MAHDQSASNIQFIEVDVVSCENEKCYSEITSLISELEAHQEKIEQISQQYHNMLIENLKKDGTIRKLEAILLKSGYLSEFRDILSEAFDELNLVANVPEKDSTFILRLMRHVYKNDLPGLKNKTYSNNGRSKSKTPLTPTKLGLVRRIFEKRVKDNQSDDRLAMFGKHVKTALESINKNENRTTSNKPSNENNTS